MEYFLSSALIEKWRRMYAALQNTPFLTKMWDSEEQNNWPLSQKNFLGISFFSPKLPPIHEKWNTFLLFSWLLFCMLLFSKLEWWQSIYCTWGTCSFPKGGFNRTPCISLSMSFYCVWMCMEYAGWFYYLKEIGFPSVLWGKKCIPVFNKLSLNCKKISFAKDTIISQSFIFTLLREKILCRILKLITERHRKISINCFYSEFVPKVALLYVS